jgi:hypothetical protein
MNERIFELKKIIEEGKLLSANMFRIDNFDGALESREEPEFELEWLRVFRELEELKSTQRISELEIKLVDSIREIVFKKACENGGNSLAPYISDDFGLIALSLFLNYRDTWLNSLWLQYKKDHFPDTELIPIELDINKDILELCQV